MKKPLVALVVLLSVPVFGSQSKLPPEFDEAIENAPELRPILSAPPVLSSGLGDAPNGIGLPVLDWFPVGFDSMSAQPRDPRGTFTLSPGAWELRSEAYSVQPGGVRHAAGEGYVVAPMRGSGADVIQRILAGAYEHPEVSQRDVQTLLWAVLSRASLVTSRPVQAAAAQLLTSDAIAPLESWRLDPVPAPLRAQLSEWLPYIAAQRVRAEAEIRELLSVPEVRFEALEQAAVAGGDVESVLGDRDLLEGRWSHYAGIFVRPAPIDDRTMTVQVVVPEGRLPRIVRDGAGRIREALYANGVTIVAEYDDAREPMAVNGDPGVRGYLFRRITVAAGGDRAAEATGRGWTFVGQPRGGGVFSSTPAADGADAVYPDRAERYRTAVWWANGSGARDLKAGSASALNAADMLDDQLLREGIRDAFAGRPQADLRVVALLDVAPFEWIHCRLSATSCGVSPAAAGASRRTVSFDPTSIVVVPGKKGRQRLALTGRTPRP